MNSKNILIILGVIVVLGLGFYFLRGRGSYKTVTTVPTSTSTPSASGLPAVGGSKITIQNFQFSPSSLTVKAGDTVTFTNMDSVAHTIVSDDGTTFDTGSLAQGQSNSFTAPTKLGTYAFHCSIHPTMTGTLIVK